ncbi:MAG: hypothetical protein EHM58_02540 [Ignavibacteriae bacterium]|nr:MAG: hypothetical protein EHM58_02540 [Ignavibacteriota bacterium]
MFIELMIIILLSLVIKTFIRERNALIKDMAEVHKTSNIKLQAKTEQFLEIAHRISLKLPTELYSQSFKKNIVVKETANMFYKLLTKYIN